MRISGQGLDVSQVLYLMLTKNAFSFKIVKKGSDLLIEEFPNYKDIISTKEEIEKI